MRKAAILLVITGLVCMALFAPGNGARGEQYEYRSKGRRDPFIPLVGSNKIAAGGLEDVSSVDDIKLEGIAYELRVEGQPKKTVIMNGEIMGENERIGIVEVKEIMKGSVKLSVGGKEYTLALPEEGGIKSEK
ncbi:MAG: hypothetical protein JW919_04900 [Candidatus Omnitrophica bacterium]|nr:hypothetical protein [Candidatus Omnitrophota bacterium]